MLPQNILQKQYKGQTASIGTRIHSMGVGKQTTLIQQNNSMLGPVHGSFNAQQRHLVKSNSTHASNTLEAKMNKLSSMRATEQSSGHQKERTMRRTRNGFTMLPNGPQ